MKKEEYRTEEATCYTGLQELVRLVLSKQWPVHANWASATLT